MEQKIKITIDNIHDNGCLSVLKTTYVVFNGQEIVLENHREALTPSQFDRAKEILPDNQYAAVIALWTPKVVAEWEAKQAQSILI